MKLSLMMGGVHCSGKTTFLAALYEWVEAGVPGGLRFREEPADREYFFEISQEWLKLEELTHSNIAAPRYTEMPLVDPNGFEFDLRIPDVVGESFGQAWEGKEWPKEVAEIAEAADGLLLFLHGAELEPPLKLPPGDAFDSSHAGEGEGPAGQASGGLREPAEWDASKAPTQTILADLLEGVRGRRESMPTAVIVSAWDRVLDESEVTPATWLQANLPLLWQMLEGRKDAVPYEVFGVSAQGGDVTNGPKRDELAAVRPPHERIIVQQDETRTADIGAPIRWLLDQARDAT